MPLAAVALVVVPLKLFFVVPLGSEVRWGEMCLAEVLICEFYFIFVNFDL